MLTTLVFGCATTLENREDQQEAKVVMPSTVEVTLDPPSQLQGFRWENESIARVLRTMESALHAAPGVVVHVKGTPPPPAVRRTPTSTQGSWGISIGLSGTIDSLELRALTCPPSGACYDEVTYTDARKPEGGAAVIVTKIMERIGVTAPASALECVFAPPSEDNYSSLVAGRGAAVLYGLVTPTTPGDRSDDPMERAVYLDPDMGLAQWVAGRGRLGRGQLDKAAGAFTIASEMCPSHPGFAADLARVELDRGRINDAAAILDGLEGMDDDPRLVPLRLDTWVQGNRLEAAEALGKIANRTFPDDAQVAEVLAELSLAKGQREEYESWLEEWARRDEADAEPVRRLVSILATDARWREVWTTLDRLEARGVHDEVRRWRVTAGLALNRYEEAAAAAEPALASRIRARAALEGASGFTLDLDIDSSPEARVARGTALMWSGSPEGALEEATAALRDRPWWPEALALQADALQALGQPERAERVREDWRRAEPPLEQ